MAVIPAWVVPSAREVADLHWLAWRAIADSRSPHAGGVENVLVWLGGEEPAPITDRAEHPVTREAAELEMRAAGAAQEPTSVLHRLVAEELGVATWAPQPRSAEWTNAVYLTLRWLLGDGDPPMEVPARDAEGHLATAADLYERAVAAQPGRFSLPEQRAELRLRAERDAARSRRLAELIDDTKNQRWYTVR